MASLTGKKISSLKCSNAKFLLPRNLISPYDIAGSTDHRSKSLLRCRTNQHQYPSTSHQEIANSFPHQNLHQNRKRPIPTAPSDSKHLLSRNLPREASSCPPWDLHAWTPIVFRTTLGTNSHLLYHMYILSSRVVC